MRPRILLLYIILAVSWLAARAFNDGERIALLGDSMTWIGGDSCENPKGWSHYLQTAFPASPIDVYARSGATWTNTKDTRLDPGHYSEILDDRNVMFNQVARLLSAIETDPGKAPGLVVLYAGANDAWFQTLRPGIFDETNLPETQLPSAIGSLKEVDPSACTSLASSVWLCCTLLKQRLPEASLILVTPVEMSRASVADIRKVGDTIERVGIELGIPTIRGDRDIPIRRAEESGQHKKHTYDGVHTNPAGARLIAETIHHFITTR